MSRPESPRRVAPGATGIRVLYAHPDRWTVGAEFPPEEVTRMRAALSGFAVEWLAWKSPAKVEHHGAAVDDREEQRIALEAWRESARAFGPRARRTRGGRGRGYDARPLVEAALDAVVTGALWESPLFRTAEGTLSFHRAWRIVVEVGVEDERALSPLATRWRLLVRNR